MLMYRITKIAQEEQQIQLLIEMPWLHYLVFIIPIISSIRLAKFNIDTRQTKSFIGLAVPAHAAFYIFSTLLYLSEDLQTIINVDSIVGITKNPLIMLLLCIPLSLMMLAVNFQDDLSCFYPVLLGTKID